MFVYIIAGSILVMNVVRPRLIFPADPGATVTAIAAHQLMFRSACTSELLMAAGLVLLAWALYVLLAPVNRSLALLGLSWRLVEAVLWGGAVLVNYVIAQVVHRAGGADALEASQLHAMVGVLVRANSAAMDIVVLFTGLGTIVFSYLLWKSRYVPRLLAAWGIFTYLSMILYCTAKLVLPSLASWDMIVYTPGGLFEAVVGVWLLVLGLTAQGPSPTGPSMKAIFYEEYGGPEVLQLREVPKPEPRKDELLIKIRATSVTSSEVMMRRGKPWFGRPVIGLTRPGKKVLGLEFAGEVAGLGAEARKFKIGDRVFGFTGFRCGAYAQYTCVSESGSVVLMPSTVSFEEAVALVDGPTTALFFLEKAKIRPAERVLIYGASGSVGTAAVQLAASMGAEVTAVCSEANFELVRSLGAHTVLDYHQEDFTRRSETYDVIFDTVGKTSFAKSKRCLKRSGRYLVTVMSLEALGQMLLTSIAGDKKAIFALSIGKLAELQRIKELVELGKHKPVIDVCYPLERIGEAHAYVEMGHKKGNVVIRVGHAVD